jgi:DsbC/DsbD-like thiol-disulfide interchange protein
MRAALAGLIAGLPHSASAESPLQTKWQQTPKSISRLVVGSLPVPGEAPRLIVGVEIHIERDWKTYWRHPGDAGGVPPRFDFSKSQNLKSANVLFPVPERISDPSGSLIGYKEHVIFPVEVEAVDPSRPVRLSLAMEFGVCREICILAQAQHNLTVRTTKSFSLSPPLYAALERVPRQEQALRPDDPRLKSVAARLDGPAPGITFDIAYPKGTRKRIDMFVETLSGTNLPLPRKMKSETLDGARFEVQVPADISPGSLRGRQLRVTLISARGASEYVRTLE